MSNVRVMRIAKATLAGCNSPFCFNTPFLSFELYNEENESQPVMPDGAQDALAALRVEVQAYIDGKRSQGDLFERIDEIGRENGMPQSVIGAVKKDYAR